MKKLELKGILRLIIIPLVLLIIYLFVFLLLKLFNLPPPVELVGIIAEYFSKYGLWLIFIGALIEGLLILGQYFPGGIVFFLGILSAKGNMLRLAQIIIIVSLSFFIAYCINYFMGKYGWYQLFLKFGLKKSLDNAEHRLSKYGPGAIILSCFGPNLAAIISTAAGVLHYSLKKFIFCITIGVLIWNVFWGLIVFKFKEVALKLMDIRYVILIFLIWIILTITIEFIKNKKEKFKSYLF